MTDMLRSWLKPEKLDSLRFALRMANYGPHAVYAAMTLRRMAFGAGLFPHPVSEAFIMDVVLKTESQRRSFRYTLASFGNLVRGVSRKIAERVNNPTAVVETHTYVDIALRDHGIAPIPPITEQAPLPEEPGMAEARKLIESVVAEVEAFEATKRRNL